MFEEIKIVKPEEIEKKSMAIITEILGERTFPPGQDRIIKRVIHTTADFDFAEIMQFSSGAIEKGLAAFKAGANIVTDTQMAAAGINKRVLARYGGRVICFMDDETVCREAAARGLTRAAVSMERAVSDPHNKIFAIGNAPTALIRLYELIREGLVVPELVVGVPVGFVNVVESKILLQKSGIPSIVSTGRKGGSTVAAAIINALLYMLETDYNC